ncbi:MAG: hypothetical protein ACT4P4_16360 [Betaproteobacteria bacterium]
MARVFGSASAPLRRRTSALFVPRSYVASLRSWLELGAHQYGLAKSDAT